MRILRARIRGEEGVICSKNCADCWYNDYDEELDMEVCRMDLDEDEVYRIYTDRNGDCPYFRKGDDYTLARRQ